MSDSNIHCIVDISAKSESVEKVRSVLLTLVEYTRHEDGCLQYKLFENINDKSQFTMIEKWTSNEAYENHLQSDHIQKASFDINNDVTKPPDIKRYKSAQSELNQMKNSKTSRFCVL
jgi:quinol monooxygenase YgiN